MAEFTTTVVFGVYSVPMEQYGMDDAQETLYNVTNDAFSAAVWMGRFIVFRAFHLIPYDDFHKLATTLHKIVEDRRFNAMIRCVDTVFYVRQLTMDEIKDIITLDRVSQP